jgi:uncharacterized protein (DUF885 family)
MRRVTACLSLVLACLPAAIVATPAGDTAARTGSETEKLHILFDREWEWNMESYPEWATGIGDDRYNDRWTDMSLAAIATRKEHSREVLARLKEIDRSALSPADQLNLDLFRHQAEMRVAGQRFPDELLVVSQFGGVHTRAAGMARQIPRSSAGDFEDFLKRLRAVPAQVDQHIVLLEKGSEIGVTIPRIVLGDVGQLIQNHIVEDPKDSPIYTLAFAEMPASIAAADQERIRTEALSVLSEEVIPAYHKFHRYFVEDYEPAARRTIACSDLPDGEAWYAYRIREETTTEMTADEIHALGLAEVERIRVEMEKIRSQVGFEGDLAAFFEFLRTDPQFYFTEEEMLLMTYRDIAKRIDPGLPRLFKTLPRLTYGVVAVPEYSEKTQTTAYYNGGSYEAGRPGLFYANTYDLPSRPRWEMEALTLHEAVPGHHFQMSLAAELGDLPEFRRHGWFTAYGEGWALYAESLGPELDMYRDPYSKFGQLTYEMWRAIRLVVDTGIHTMGWTRQQAIDFFMENAGKTEHDVRVEVDRYIAWPGQALAYKIGELKLKELRAHAEVELGSSFDIREFHDQVLLAGALPLAILESRIREWVAGQREGQEEI